MYNTSGAEKNKQIRLEALKRLVFLYRQGEKGSTIGNISQQEIRKLCDKENIIGLDFKKGNSRAYQIQDRAGRKYWIKTSQVYENDSVGINCLLPLFGLPAVSQTFYISKDSSGKPLNYILSRDAGEPLQNPEQYRDSSIQMDEIKKKGYVDVDTISMRDTAGLVFLGVQDLCKSNVKHVSLSKNLSGGKKGLVVFDSQIHRGDISVIKRVVSNGNICYDLQIKEKGELPTKYDNVSCNNILEIHEKLNPSGNHGDRVSVAKMATQMIHNILIENNIYIPGDLEKFIVSGFILSGVYTHYDTIDKKGGIEKILQNMPIQDERVNKAITEHCKELRPMNDYLCQKWTKSYNKCIEDYDYSGYIKLFNQQIKDPAFSFMKNPRALYDIETRKQIQSEQQISAPITRYNIARTTSSFR